MAITATLVQQGYNRLRYLITSTATAGSETVNIGTIGGATPDVLTDALGSSVLKQLAQCVANGYGTFAVGAQTQAKARALWLSDWGANMAAGPSIANSGGKPTAVCSLVPTGAASIYGFIVDADVSAGNPIITVTYTSSGAGSSAYLDIEVPNQIGA